MKLILLLLLLFPINCNAEEHYTDYHLFEESENYYEETNLLKREEKKLYLNYKYEISNEEYYPLDENPEEVPFINKEDFIVIDNEESRKKTNLYIDDYQNIKYIKLFNFKGDLTKINYVLTSNDNSPVPWDIQYINRYIKEIVTPESIIVLKLRESQYYEKFQILIAIISTSETDFSFDLAISEDGNSYKEFNINIDNKDLNKEYIFTFTNNEENIGISFSESKTLYKYYDLEKIYTDIYSEEPLLDHYHDLEQFKTIYTYYKREKLEEPLKEENEEPKYEFKENYEVELDNQLILKPNQLIDAKKQSEFLNEKLKLKNTTKNDLNKESIIEKEQIKEEPKTKEKVNNKLNLNLLIAFIVASTIKSVIKKKKQFNKL